MKDVDIRYIKANYSYQVEELAELIGLNKNSILSWVQNEGLKLIDDRVPYFVHGKEFIRFIKHRQTKNRSPLPFGHLFCFKCRSPRLPQPDSATLAKKEKVLHYLGICPFCVTRLSLILPLNYASRLEALIASKMTDSRLIESEVPHRNRYKLEDDNVNEFNPENERIKHQYFVYKREAGKSGGQSPNTIDKIRKGLVRFEQYTQFASFKTFDDHVAIGFKQHLLTSNNQDGSPLSLSTIGHVLSSTQEFLRWLALLPGFKKAIKHQHIDYLNLKESERNTLKGRKLKSYPTLDQVRKILFSRIPVTEIEMRNQAMIALLVSTGVRDGALVGLKLKHINTEDKVLSQIPPEVRTKAGKTIFTRFYPFGNDIHQVILDWVKYLRHDKGFDDCCALFPKEGLTHDGDFAVRRGTLSRNHWADAGRVREIVKEEFAKAGLPTYSPHRFRDTISAMGRAKHMSFEARLAWARNMGHEHPQTTFLAYAPMSPEEHIEILKGLERSQPSETRLQEALAVITETLAARQ